MPATLVLDKIENASYSDTWDQRDPTTYSRRVVRTGIIKDLDPSTPSAMMFNATVVSGMPSYGDLHPGRTDTFLSGRTITVTNGMSGTQARVELVYQTLDTRGFLGGVSYVLRDTTSMSNEPRQMDEVTWKPYRVNIPGTSLFKPVTLNKIVPLRTLLASRVFYGSGNLPTDAMRNAQGYVNDQYWHGLPVGYWLCTGFENDLVQLNYAYSVTATWITRVVRDWSDFAFYVTDQGEVHPGIIAAGESGAIQDVMTSDYEYGWGDGGIPGFLWAGQYDVADFASIFGLT